MAAGQHARGIEQMKDALQHAENDFDHARNLYDQIAPFYSGAEMAEKVLAERGEAAKYLAQAEAASGDPVGNPPKQNP